MADIPHLIQQLRSDDWDTARQAVIALGSTAVEPLLAELRSPEEGARVRAIQLLAHIPDPDPRVAPALMELTTREPVFYVCREAVEKLATFPTTPHLQDFLLRTARHRDHNVSVRMSAVHTLGRVSGEEAGHAAWLELLNDPDSEMVMNAAFNLGQARNASFFAPLLATLKRLRTSDPAFESVLGALGKSGDPCAFEHIAPYLNDAPTGVRAVAIAALRDLGDQRALALIVPLRRDRTIVDYEDRGGPPYTLGSIAREAMQALRQAPDPAPKQRPIDSAPQRPWWKFW